MTGAINLRSDFFTGRTLLNLDSEDEGILFIGCAGGMDTVGTMNYQACSCTRKIHLLLIFQLQVCMVVIQVMKFTKDMAMQ